MSNTQLITLDSLHVTSTPAKISANFAEIDALLDQYLEKSLTVVTEESVKSEKTDLANLRKLDKKIGETITEEVNLASGEINDFKDNGKKLRLKVQSVISEKAKQIETLETNAKAEIAIMLSRYLHEKWEEYGVLPEFRNGGIDDLTKLTAITPAGSLTGASISAIDAKARESLSLQTKIEARLTGLEVRCLRAEINPPLTRTHIEPFLFSDDETFDSKVTQLITSEVERKQEMERRLKEKIEADKKREIEQALAEQKASMAQEKPTPEQPTTVKNTVVQNEENLSMSQQGISTTKPEDIESVPWLINATVQIRLTSRPNANREKMKAYFTEVLQKHSGLTVVSMDINRA